MSKLVADITGFLKKRSDHTSVAVATRTVELLRDVATQRRWNTARYFFFGAFCSLPLDPSSWCARSQGPHGDYPRSRHAA